MKEINIFRTVNDGLNLNEKLIFRIFCGKDNVKVSKIIFLHNEEEFRFWIKNILFYNFYDFAT